MSRIFVFIITLGLLIFLPTTLLLGQTSKKKSRKAKKSKLLSLSTLPMTNKTGSKNYDYLSDSLSSAINVQLRKKFTYRQYSNSKAKSFLKSILKKENKKWIDINEAHIIRLSQKKDINIVIYGEYRKFTSGREDSDRVLIRVGVFLESQKKTHWLSDVASVDASLFAIIEDVADDVVSKINELLIGGADQEKDPYKIVFRIKKHKNKSLHEKLQDEAKKLRDHFSGEHDSQILSQEEFQDEILEKNPEAKKKNISKKKTLLKQMKKFLIANLIEVQLKKKTVIIKVSIFGKQKRKRKYNINASDEEKARIWSGLVRSLAGSLKKETKKTDAQGKEGRQALVKTALPEKPRLIAPELGIRVGYLYPLLFGDIPDPGVTSAKGYSFEIHYSLPLSYFNVLSDYSDLPELYAFTALERYEIENTERKRSIIALRGTLSLGFLYPYYFGESHSLKGGMTVGLTYRSITLGDIASSSDVLLSANVLFGYGFTYKNINFSIFSRTLFSPGKDFHVLGFGASFGAGYFLQ